VWEFLGGIAERHGLAALIVIATYAGLGVAIRELWKRLHTERDAHEALEKAHDEALAKLGKEHTEALAKVLREEFEKRSAMRTEVEREIAMLRGQLHGEAAKHAERLDVLHEKRTDELRDVLREALEHMGATRSSVEKITEAMSTLRDVVRR
jgi:DNA anti-recombination protein RmuC